jgi:type I restriction enzyme S subunit
MAGDWPLRTIGECAADEPYSTQIGPFGDKIRSDTYTAQGAPVLRGTNVNTDARFHDGDFAFIDRTSADAEFGKFVCEADDVILCHKGTLGKIGIIPNRSRFKKYIMGNSMMKVRCDRTKLEPLFLYYWLTSHDGQDYLFSRVSQVGVPQIQRPLTTLREATLPVPPIPEQRAIAHILGTLDDKIELNRRVNETLDEMARALFKSWFVDFDPVHAKADGRDPGLPQPVADLFPSRLVNSDLGEIPDGWDVGVLDQLTDSVLGGDWGSDEPDAERSMEAYCMRGADIPDLQCGGKGKMPRRFLKPLSLSKRQLGDGDLVIEISGGSPTQSTGRPVLVARELLDRVGRPVVCSNFCRMIKFKSPLASKFVYLWLRWVYQNDELLQFENGTTGIKNLAFTLFSASYKIVIPPPMVLEAFDRSVTPIFRRHQASNGESDTLAVLRDALLPKLVSGELRVTDAGGAIEAVI